MTDQAILIRKSTPADLEALHRVIERAYRGDTAKMGWTHEADLLHDTRTDIATLQAIVSDPNECLLAAVSTNTIIGCVQLSPRPNNGCYLGLLCIEPTLQAAGLGKQILATAEAYARTELAADHIIMTVIDKRTELIAYYERRGYLRTGDICDFPVTVDPPLFMVILRKSI